MGSPGLHTQVVSVAEADAICLINALRLQLINVFVHVMYWLSENAQFSRCIELLISCSFSSIIYCLSLGTHSLPGIPQ